MNNDPEIEQLEIEVNSNPNSISSLCRLSELYFSDGRGNKAAPLVRRAIEVFLKTQLTVSQGLSVFEISLRLWKTERFANKKLMRLNASKERKQLLEQIHLVILALLAMRDPKQGSLIAFKAAYVKEAIGAFQDSLSLLSDLIAIQAVEGVDFSYIILKAAVLLKNLGQNKQSIEYLEYLEEDPPIDSGYTKTHILSLLILVYEQSAEKYRVFLSSTYKKLLASCQEDVANNKDNNSKSKQFRKLLEIVSNKNLPNSSELWEVLAIQAMDRCEYVLALEYLQHANFKSPGKGSILLWLVEICYLLGDLAKASKYGEKATVVLPQSADLRNLLIQIDPEKWTEKLRFISPTKGATATTDLPPEAVSRDRARSPSRKTMAVASEGFDNNHLMSSGNLLGGSQRAKTPPKSQQGPSRGGKKETKEESRPISGNNNDSAVNWFSKITNSAASAIHVRFFFLSCRAV
jgi:tetratricopeptide (TPR) repeat protein